MNNKGFLSTSTIYSFFLVFLVTLLFLITQYTSNRNIYSNIKKEIISDINSSFKVEDVCVKNTNLSNCIKSFYTGVQGENSIYYHNGTITKNGTILDARDNSYRYSGANVNNYICFGTDNDYCDDNYLYRIIGVFGNTVKLIKAKEYTNDYWSGSASNETNNWILSTLNTSVLNNTYLNSLGSIWQNKILLANYKIGKVNLEYNNVYDIYKKEFVDNPTVYAAKIALPYISDYYYAGTVDNWVKSAGSMNSTSEVNWFNINSTEWYLDAWSNYDLFAYNINSYGNSAIGFTYASQYTVRPTFYLNESVKYKSGSGTYYNPFRIVSEGSISQADCPAGSYCNGESINACIGKNHFSTAGSKTCSTVSNGYYTIGCDASGNYCKGQQQCEPGYYCENGVKVACSTLGNGYTSNAGASGKSGCYISVSAGQYKTSATGNTTTGCGAGKYSIAHNSAYGVADTSCANISAGCYGTSGTSSCPSQCTGRTQYCPGGTSNYSTVSSGYYSTGCTGNNKCTGQSQCSANTYCSGGISYSCPSGQTSAAGATSCYTPSCTVYCTSTTSCSKTRPSDNILYGVFTCTGGTTGSIEQCWYGSTKCNMGKYNTDPDTYICKMTGTYYPSGYNALSKSCNKDIGYDGTGVAPGLSGSGYSCSCS